MGHAPHRHRPRYGPRRRTAPGSPPGTLVVDPRAPAPRMQVFSYGADAFRELPEASLDDVAANAAEGRTLWLNVDGLGHADTLERIGERFTLHPLALEDVVNVHQRPKFEAYDDQLFLIVRVPLPAVDAPAPPATGLHTEQVAICLGRAHATRIHDLKRDLLNEVMKVLTIIATIFIPLTFVAGSYGMNVDPGAGPWSMPESAWRYGYPAVMALMLAVAVGLVLWFRRMGWIGRERGR